ncbi:reverse transcriptase domain-containing protein [Tanacetum coccineum]
MLSNYFQMNKPSGSGPLHNNTVTNPKGDLKAITTRSGISYDGPPIPLLSLLLPRWWKESPRPKFASTFMNLLSNKEKLFKLANTPVNENCSVVILKKLLEKLGDPGKFLIPCNFPEIVECLALADLGASINLMPLSIWRKLSLLELTPTQMILKLADRSTTRPTGIAEDVFVRDFLTIRGNPTPISEPIIAKSSPSLTPFEGGDFILEEIEAYLASNSVPPGIKDVEFDPEGDIRLIKEMLNNDTYSPLPPKELKCEELKTVKSSVDEPPELELKDLPSHLEYAFLEGHMAIFHDMIEETMEVFMDDFRPFGDSFSSCLSHLDKMLKRCEDTNIVLNWEKYPLHGQRGHVPRHQILDL